MKTIKDLTEKERELADKYFSLAMQYSKKWKRKHPTKIDEIESATSIILLEAIQTFSEGKNYIFEDYLRFKMTNMTRLLNREKDKCLRNLQRSGLFDIKENRDYFLESIEIFDDLAKDLPEKYTYILKEKFLYGRSTKEIAQELGYCKNSILRIINEKIRTILKKRFNETRICPRIVSKQKEQTIVPCNGYEN